MHDEVPTDDDDWVASGPDCTWKPLEPTLQSWTPGKNAKLPPDDDLLDENADLNDELWVRKFCGRNDALACSNCFSFVTWDWIPCSDGWVADSAPGCQLGGRKRGLLGRTEISPKVPRFESTNCVSAAAASDIAAVAEHGSQHKDDIDEDETVVVCTDCRVTLGLSTIIEGKRIYYLDSVLPLAE